MSDEDQEFVDVESVRYILRFISAVPFLSNVRPAFSRFVYYDLCPHCISIELVSLRSFNSVGLTLMIIW